MSRLGEFILRKLSREPQKIDYINEHYEQKHKDITVYMEYLSHTFPNIKAAISNKYILDIGCSEGMESFSLSLLGAHQVYGIDILIDPLRNKELRNEYSSKGVSVCVMSAENTAFPSECFDVIVTCGSFEHFQDPFKVLRECRRLLKIGGKIFLTSGVWCHPWGAHMNFFTKLPWLQFLFSETTVMNVRMLYRNDGAKKYSEVEGGLNKIGIRMLKQIAKELNFQIDYIKLNPVKGLTYLTYLPFINEFFTNLIIAILRK